MNFTEVIYKAITNRIKEFMVEYGVNLTELSEETEIPYTSLSKIRNMRIHPRRNPYLLSVEQINSLVRGMNTLMDKAMNKNKVMDKKISRVGLVWGNEAERERFIKITLVAILMNGSKTDPFIHFDEENPKKNCRDLLEWAYDQNNIKNTDLSRVLYNALEITRKPDFNMDDVIPESSVVTNAKKHEFYKNALLIFKIKAKYMRNQIKYKLKSIAYEKCKIEKIKRKSTLLELYNKIQDFYKKEFPFFFNSKNKEDYDTLISDNLVDHDIDELSFLILTQIMDDYSFSQFFALQLSKKIGWELCYRENIERIENGPQKIKHTIMETFPDLKYYPDNEENTHYSKTLEDFLLQRGKYGDMITDFGKWNFYLFVNAFENFWKNKREKYMSYFEKNLFDEAIIEKSGLKQFTNTKLMEIINSKILKENIRNINILEEYTNPKSIIIKNNLQTMLQSTILQEMLAPNDPTLNEVKDTLLNINKQMNECIASLISIEKEKRNLSQ